MQDPWFGSLTEAEPAYPYTHWEYIYTVGGPSISSPYTCDDNYWAKNVQYKFGDLALQSMKHAEGIWYSVDRTGNVRVHMWSNSGLGMS